MSVTIHLVPVPGIGFWHRRSEGGRWTTSWRFSRLPYSATVREVMLTAQDAG